MSTLEQAAAATNGAGAHGDTIPVENPATGATIAHVPDMGRADVEQMVARARVAQPVWAAVPIKERAALLLDARRWLVKNRDKVIRTLIEENGKTREDALLGELLVVCNALTYWAKQGPKHLADEKARPFSPLLWGKKLLVRYVPHGVVGVIGPWNYPLSNNFGDAAPALLAGNSVVLKPSDVTPLTSLLMADAMREIGLPDDVFQVATGRGETGAAIVETVDMVHFTGSTATGRKVAEVAAKRLIPVTLELGGKDPMIVLDDADLTRAAGSAVYNSLQNGGQTCISVERAYVHEKVYDEFVEKVVSQVKGLRQGPPRPDGGDVEVGAVTFGPQLDVVEQHVRDAVEKGAKLRAGGRRRDGDGRFFEPTVLTDVDHSMEIMTEETFGPTLPIMKVRDEEEAIRLANESRYGLDSSVWTRDIDRGERVARQIQAGATCVNDALSNYLAADLPMGGIRESGIGVRHGAAGIRKYCRMHSILVTRFGMKRELWWFPYSKRGTRLFERLVVLLYGRGGRRR